MIFSRTILFGHTLLSCLLFCLPLLAQDDASPVQAFEAGGTVPKENLPAWPFLYGAYFCFWALLFGYMIYTWRRSVQISGRIAHLDARLDQIDADIERIEGASQ